MREFTDKQLKDLDDDKIPTSGTPIPSPTHNEDSWESIEQWEEKNGRGFWGNQTTGYIYNKDNK